MIDIDDVAFEDRVSADTSDFDDGMPQGIITGCDPDEYTIDDDDEGNWVDTPEDAGDVHDIEYDR
jgi:hypothetical protein